MGDKYSKLGDPLVAFAFLSNALESRHGGDGDTDASFPRSDAEDLSRGCRFIPGEVTMARRRGERVSFVSDCGQCCWYWQMSDGSRIYHFERFTYERIKACNGITDDKALAGPCPNCGNPRTNGGTVTATELRL